MRTYKVETNVRRLRPLKQIKFEACHLYGIDKMSAEMFANLFKQWLEDELNCVAYSEGDLIKLYCNIHYHTPKTDNTSIDVFDGRFTITYTMNGVWPDVSITYNRVSKTYTYKEINDEN